MAGGFGFLLECNDPFPTVQHRNGGFAGRDFFLLIICFALFTNGVIIRKPSDFGR